MSDRKWCGRRSEVEIDFAPNASEQGTKEEGAKGGTIRNRISDIAHCLLFFETLRYVRNMLTSHGY